ncbi:MAG TPA: type II CAAX endopeptidase family protein, partial [Ktedonobacterales bacterium]|nr:type II CAAX endopeptidase family protein [Ktedonobacterales bacterium]
AMYPRSRRASFLVATLFGLAWFPLILLAIIIGNTVAGTLILHTAHPTPAQLPTFMYATDMTMLVLGVLWCLLGVPATLQVRPRAYGQFLRDIGVLGGSWRALVASGGLLLLVLLVATVSPNAIASSFSPAHTDAFSWADLVQPPVVEEMLFRGVVLTVLVRRFPIWFAVLWAAVLFMPPHLNQGPLLMVEDGLIFGITQGLLRLRTRSIWPGAVAHYLFITQIGVPILIAYSVVLAALVVEWGVHAARMGRKQRLPVASPAPVEPS